MTMSYDDEPSGPTDGDRVGPPGQAAGDVGRVAMLAEAGRLLLEFNESTGVIRRVLAETAAATGVGPCSVTVDYDGVKVSAAGASATEPVTELRFNTAAQARVH